MQAFLLEPKPALPKIPDLARAPLLHLASKFRIGQLRGDEAITEGQLTIFWALIFRPATRVEILCSTQYGKSLWVALACIIIACVQGIRVAIVAPSDAKAKIIMRYFIDHLGDSPVFYGKLEKNTRLERLRQEESKERIMLNNGGGIYVISAQQKNAKASIEAAMGEGAKIVIGDEFGLIQDDTEATIFRMIAGQGPEGFYCKIGNPFYSMPPYSHFHKTWNSTRYLRIFIDYVRALAEGRYTPEFIEESRGKPLFDVLYACEFPAEDTMDRDGYRPLVMSTDLHFGITPDILQGIIEKDLAAAGGDVAKLPHRPKGASDIAGGGDRNTHAVRYGRFACAVGWNRSADTMTNVGEIEAHAARFHVAPTDWAVDDIGIGHGVSDRLHERKFFCTRFNAAAPARDTGTFANAKAEACWAMRTWLQHPDSRLDTRDEWLECTWLRYKTQSDRQVIMEPKAKLKLRTGASPDFAEALYMTFADPAFVGFA